jgi:hypothetical protein
MKDGADMKHKKYVWLAAMILASTLSLPLAAQNQPLGDYARAVRKDKPKEQAAVKKFDNDNLPTNDKLSIVGNAPADSTDASAGNAAPSAEKAEEKGPASQAELQKGYDQWKQKIDSQKQQIDINTRELDVMQREYRLRAAAFYADAGARLRNSGSWDKEDAQYKQQIAAKQKSLDAAKKQLEDLQEQARKSGVPSSVRQ